VEISSEKIATIFQVPERMVAEVAVDLVGIGTKSAKEPNMTVRKTKVEQIIMSSRRTGKPLRPCKGSGVVKRNAKLLTMLAEGDRGRGQINRAAVSGLIPRRAGRQEFRNRTQSKVE